MGFTNERLGDDDFHRVNEPLYDPLNALARGFTIWSEGAVEVAVGSGEDLDGVEGGGEFVEWVGHGPLRV